MNNLATGPLATKELIPDEYDYDLKMVENSSHVSTLVYGKFNVLSDVTRSVT